MASPARGLRAPLRHVADGRWRSLPSPARSARQCILRSRRRGPEMSAEWGVGEEQPLDSVDDGGAVGVHFFSDLGGLDEENDWLTTSLRRPSLSHCRPAGSVGSHGPASNVSLGRLQP